MNDYSYVVSGGNASSEANAGYLLEEDSTLITGHKSLADSLDCVLTTMERDLLRVASAVFAADRASLRGEREQLTRRISLRVPVTNLELFIPLTRRLELLLKEMSLDIWRLKFVARKSNEGAADDEAMVWPASSGRTLLFSGGLDSLAAAIEFSADPTSLLLVSHRTHNPATDKAQKDLVSVLIEAGRNLDHIQAFISSRDTAGLDHDVEPSQRTRSFVFLAVGAICARRTGKQEVVCMAENGQMAIHLPLTVARVGAFSTRTAHPLVLASAESLLADLLSFPLKIRNPYLYLTKAEVVGKVRKEFAHAIALSTSCWKNARVTGGATHCGVCVPCIVRRIAVESSGSDPTVYAKDAFVTPISRLASDDDSRRNLYDVAEFTQLFRNAKDEELLMEFPDLHSEFFDASEAIQMYRRFAHEARSVLAKYTAVAPLLT